MTMKFTSTHEWLRFDDNDDNTVTVGITAHAVEQLGDIVFVDLPPPDAKLERGAEAAAVESVKAAADVYCPLDGKVVGVNEDVVADPALVNADPEGKGWFFTLRTAATPETEGLLDADAYRKLIA